MIKAQTLKGFRDFLPKQAKKRQYVIDILRKTFESFGFDPLETPALEYEEVLLGKYGDEADKLMYRFEDNGKRKVALRYDQTVPLARVVAQYQNELPLPFKRYQIQPVWRAENTQKGRFREFMQCDADIVGSSSLLSDAEVIALTANSLQKLGCKKFKIFINDRKSTSYFKTNFDISTEKIPCMWRAFDKRRKTGEEGVKEELIKCGFSITETETLVSNAKMAPPTSELDKIFTYLKQMNMPVDLFEFDPWMARGLDYYTGMIFEIQIEGYSGGSVCGGGRYDNLIGMFAGKNIPAVGFAFGFDRLIEAMEELNLFPQNLNYSSARILVSIFNTELFYKSIELLNQLRNNNINAEIYDDPDQKLDKQLKYADKKGIPYVAIIGPDEVKNNMVTLKNLKEKKQETIPLDELVKLLRLALSGVEG